MTFVSYAQNGEDVFLHRVFGGQQTGFYVDIGAYDPIIGSVTKAIYDRGWSGINAEPGPVFDRLAAARPRDINLRMAVLDRTGEAAFVVHPIDSGMSHIAEPDAPGAAVVLCDTLENIVRVHGGGRPVDFIKIDAEGAEAAIVRATDWRRLRPALLIIEATRPWSSELVNGDWEPALLEAGYRRAYFDGINCFYVPEELEPALRRHFSVPINALDRVVLHDPTREHAAAELAQRTAERDAVQAALDRERQSWEVSSEARQAEVELASAAQQDAEAKLDAMRLDLARQGEQQSGLLAERQHLAARVEALIAERERILGARETAERAHENAVAALAAQQRVIERLQAALAAADAGQPAPAQDLVAPQAALAVPPALPPLELSSPAARRRSALRRMARLAYGVVRPVARPAAWRLRTFMSAPLVAEAQQIGARAQQLNQMGTSLAAELRAEMETQMKLLTAEYGRLGEEFSDRPLAEMRALAAKMEAALLTLAIGASQAPAGRAPAEVAALDGSVS